MTETLTSVLTETAETTTELQIPNVIEGVENASSLLTSLTDKFISALPVLAFAIIVFFAGIILSKLVVKFASKFIERSNIENTAGSFLISLSGNSSNLSWNSIDVAKTITDLTPRDFLKMTSAIFDEPEQSRKIVSICNDREFEAVVADSCIGCGLCVSMCSMKAIKLESLKAHVDSIQCCGCQLCKDECPTNSIKILEI